MDSKGQGRIIGLIIGVIAAAVLVANPLFNIIDETTATQTDRDTLEHINGGGNTSVILEKAQDGLTLETGTLSVPGLTAGNNYSIDYGTGNWTIFNSTDTGNYTGTYEYQEANYITDSSERTVMDLVFLFAIIGLVFALGRGFGLI